MEHHKEALLQELRDRTPKSGAYWETAKDLVPRLSLLHVRYRVNVSDSCESGPAGRPT